LGLAFGIKDSRHSKPPSNDILEAEFQRVKKEKKGFIINTSKVGRCNIVMLEYGLSLIEFLRM
jgi:hypothetical protein